MTDPCSNAPAAQRRGGRFPVRPSGKARGATSRQRRRRAKVRVGFAAVVFALCPLASVSAAGPPEPVTPLLAKADPAKGAKLATRCKACHTLDKGGANRFGPALWNVLGREKASVDKFKYTPSFRKLDGKWDYESINALIVNPNAVAPGTRMRFPGIKSVTQRADLIRYLRDLSDDPLPLPAATEAVARAPAAAEESAVDFQGLPPGAGREEVFYLCNACHSLKTVQQQGLPRDRWDELLHWMTEKQGMPALEGKERDVVLDYLAENYGIPDRQPMMTPMSRPPLMPLPPPPK
jgi:cytochrome c